MILEVYEHHRVDKGRTIAKIRFKRWSWWPLWSYTEALSRRVRDDRDRWQTEWYCPVRGVRLAESDRITRLVEGRETYEDFVREVDEDLRAPVVVPFQRRARR